MNTLLEILPGLVEFQSILVTGPQRSGTTIAAHILAEELGKTYVDEDEINVYNLLLAQRLMSEKAVTLQAPGLCYAAHLLHGCAVVLVVRDIKEILESEARSQWRTLYGGANVETEKSYYRGMFHLDWDNIAEMKYACWDWQKQQLGNRAFELEYNSLKGHRLWKDKPQRQNFAARQWQ